MFGEDIVQMALAEDETRWPVMGRCIREAIERRARELADREAIEVEIERRARELAAELYVDRGIREAERELATAADEPAGKPEWQEPPPSTPEPREPEPGWELERGWPEERPTFPRRRNRGPLILTALLRFR